MSGIGSIGSSSIGGTYNPVQVAVVCSLAITEDNDSATTAGLAGIRGTVAVTEDSDSSAASGYELITGTSAITEDDDSPSASALEIMAGTVTATEDNDIAAALGMVVNLPVAPIVENDTIQQFDFSVPVLSALLWQYQNAPNIQSLMASKQSWYDTNQTQFWLDFITNIFNLQTADIFGLSVWSIILGQPIVFNNAANPNQIPWGFGTNNLNFTQGNFAGGAGGSYALPLSAARIILQLRAFQLISSGTVPETNRMLAYVFADYGPAWLVDNNDMTQTYMFGFSLTADLVYIFSNIDILPRPAGVSSTYEEV